MYYIRHQEEKLPLIGFGTWCIGDQQQKEEQEVGTMLYGIDKYGMTLIDTAEMYGSGKSEQVVAKVIANVNRESLYIVDKILPGHAQEGRYEERVKQSIKILNCHYIDLYLLHWRANVNLQDMVNQMNSLVQKGYIRHWGVSNFDVKDMEDLLMCQGGDQCYANQILYNVLERGVEYDLMEYCKNHNILLMAYSSIGNSYKFQHQILKSKSLHQIAERRNCNPYNILLKFVIRNQDIIALFKSSSKEHLDDNMYAMDEPLTEEELELLELDFPSPKRKVPLQKI